MGILDKSSFLSRKRQIKEVVLSDGNSVFITPLPADFFISSNGQMGSDFRAERLIAHSLCDPQGQAWFSEEDERAVLQLNLADFKLLTQACLAVNGLSLAGSGLDMEESLEKNC
jgi:hypothetical protein